MRQNAIGFELTAARRRAGLTQAEVAELMGTTQSAVSRVESGRSVPTIDFVDRYARALGVTIRLELGASQDTIPSRAERARRVRRVLGGYVFDPWKRDLSPAEERSLEADGLTRERFQG